MLQGEREFARDNKSLGTFRLSGLPPAPRGVPQVVVTFDLSADGILRVSAKERASSKSADISITGASTLSEADVIKATRDAEAHAADDRRRREVVEARNEAESLLYSTEKALKDFRDKASSDVVARVEADMSALRSALSLEDASAIRSHCDELRASSANIGKSMYEQQGGGRPAGPSAAPPPPGQGDGTGPTIEADFRDIPE